MKIINSVSVGFFALTIGFSVARADERRFTYTYEPEVLPKGGVEFEQWLTWRTQRTSGGEVQQGNFNLWEIREELEFGITDNYSLSLYLNAANVESYSDKSQTPAAHHSSTDFEGVSIENRYMVLNPAKAPVGLTLYFEPRVSPEELELEQKIILGQRFGDWKWAFNLTHAAEWTDNMRSVEGEFEASLGIGRDLGRHWSLGLEFRDHNELPDYRYWENTALFLGPAVSYRREGWWATLTVMPQIYGANFKGDPDGNPHLELEGHEKLNIRLMFSITL